MGLFVDERKVQAAARSLHQFYPLVRSLFKHEVDNRVVEITSVFLYLRVAQEVFNRRFVDKMTQWLADGLKYAAPEDVRVGVERLTELCTTFDSAQDDLLECYSYESDYAHHVRSVIKALFTEAGAEIDPELVRDTFVPMERVITRLREHLGGIRKQNAFLMRS